uniref:Myb-like domain-containing protein n=1 Tax=Palpitomonas bilix TaxID=652834 RepID=A0A7S3DCH0_9EUKA|mmetsp:Transcript_31627/g.82545  ORF Transcript_31627/g.82545 Transcript_31627/m.82545 type:complete len:615 (+) Transcript_31627:97-1941(+)
MQTRTRPRRASVKPVKYREESDSDEDGDEAFSPTSPSTRKRGRRAAAPASRSSTAGRGKKEEESEVKKEEDAAINRSTGRLLRHLFYDEKVHPTIAKEEKKRGKAEMKQSLLLDAFKVVREGGAASNALAKKKVIDQSEVEKVEEEVEVEKKEDETDDETDEEEIVADTPTPTSAGQSQNRKNVLLARAVSHEEATRVGEHCESLRKQYEQYATREKEKKYRFIREADLPFLSDEEIEMGLKDNNDNPDEFILHFLAHPVYLQQLRERITRKYASRSETELTEEERVIHRRVQRASNKHKHAQRKAKVVCVGRLRLDDALEIGVSDDWSEARKKAFDQIDENPNSYYYRFNKPGEKQRTGGWTAQERALFFERMKEIDILCNRPQWGIFSMVFEGRVGYQCANFYRTMVKKGEVNDPNYYIDSDGKLRYKRGEAKNAVDGSPAPLSAVPAKVGKGTGKASRKRPSPTVSYVSAKRGGAKKRKRKGEDADTIFANDISGASSEEEAEIEVGFVSAKAVAAAAMAESSTDDGEEEDDDNPLPDYVDPVTLDTVERPAISPFGHVMGYDTWVKCLNYSEPKEKCPFTKKRLRLRQLVKLTKDNIHLYRDKIIASKKE